MYHKYMPFVYFMKTRNHQSLHWLCFFCVVVFSCKKETKEPATQGCTANYTTDIKPIIANKCAISGCHNGSSPQVNFSIDSNVKSRADNGRIRSYIFDLKIMPPANASALSEQEKEKMKCWLDNGAPQN